MELKNYLLVIFFCIIASPALSSEHKAQLEVGIFGEAIEIIHDPHNNHPHKKEIKQIIELFTAQNNQNSQSVSETAKELDLYLKNNKTVFSTLEDDRKKMIVFGNTLDSIQQFHQNEKNNKNSSTLPMVKELVRKFEKTMDDYFAGESTPKTIERITQTTNQFNALTKAHEQSQSHQAKPRAARKKSIVRAPQQQSQASTVKSLISSYQAAINNEMKQTELLNRELDTKIEEFKTNTPAQTIATPPTMWPSNFDSLPTTSQIVIANHEYRELDRRLSAHSNE
jgi:hypothetical protein